MNHVSSAYSTMRDASDRNTEAHTGSCKMDGKQIHILSQSCQCHILQKRSSDEIVGITELVK